MKKSNVSCFVRCKDRAKANIQTLIFDFLTTLFVLSYFCAQQDVVFPFYFPSVGADATSWPAKSNFCRQRHKPYTYFMFIRGTGVLVIAETVGVMKKRTVSQAITGQSSLFSLFDGRFLRARTRRKSFSFFHHYLSLFLISDIFPLIVSEINGVIDEW